MTDFIDVELCCPNCNSMNIRKRFWIPASKEGHLPKPPVDLCESCGFVSEESFVSINFRNIRNIKLQQILSENGV